MVFALQPIGLMKTNDCVHSTLKRCWMQSLEKIAAEKVKWLIVNEKIHNIVEINVLQMRNLSTAN